MNKHEVLGLRDLIDQRKELDSEIEKRLRDEFLRLAEAYITYFGKQGGLERFSEHLKVDVANRRFPGGWEGFVVHFNKISG